MDKKEYILRHRVVLFMLLCTFHVFAQNIKDTLKQEAFSIQEILSGCFSVYPKPSIKDSIFRSTLQKKRANLRLISRHLLDKGVPIPMSSDDFKNYVFDYTQRIEGTYEGNLPLVIEFYANWCGPCRRLKHAYSFLAQEYKRKALFYIVDVEKEKEMAKKLGILQLPTIILLPVGKSPKAIIGAPSKAELRKSINMYLFSENN